jgi:hypothetical protein
MVSMMTLDLNLTTNLKALSTEFFEHCPFKTHKRHILTFKKRTEACIPAYTTHSSALSHGPQATAMVFSVYVYLTLFSLTR